ncbi:MAG: hypothetical protein ABIZ49_00900, partial [Opitutaceae bacterium]
MFAPFTVDSADALSALQSYLAKFDSGSFHRGQAAYHGKRVLGISRVDDTTLAAQVRGAQIYHVELRRAERAWQSACSCPAGGNCEHVAAVAMDWASALLNKAPAVPTPAVRTRDAAAAAAQRSPFRTQWEPVLAQKLGRPLTADEGTFLGKLAQLFQNLRQSGRVSPVELVRLGFATNESRRAPYEGAYAGWWSRPLADPLELWQYIAYDLETSGLPVPEFMRPITDTAAAREQVQNRPRREAIRRWNERFDQLLATANAPLPAASAAALPPAFELRLSVGTGRWALETRARPEAPWKPVPRPILDRITRDATGSLATIDASPAVFAFLAVCQEHYRRTYSLAFSSGAQGSRELLHRLLSHRLARTLVVGADGLPVTFSEAPLSWGLHRSADNARDYEIALRLPDGQPLPPAALHLPGKPDFYLHNGIVYRGPPSLDGVSATAAIVPAEVVERPDVLRTLRQLGTALPAEIEARFVTVPLRARIVCTLLSDVMENEILTLELLALTDEPPAERKWQPGGWTTPPKTLPLQKAKEPDKLYSFDLTIANRAASQLGELGVNFDGHRQCWTRRITKTFAEDFIAWREALPPEVEVLATGELASLLEAPLRARIEVKLTETSAHRDWFDLALALRPEDSTLTPAEIALLLKARGKLVRLAGKGWKRLSIELDDAPIAALEAAGFDVEALGESALAGEKHRFHALQLAQTAVADLLPEQQADALRG